MSRNTNGEEVVSTTVSAPAKCLFPDQTSSTADGKTTRVRHPVPFSIGDIMKPDSPSRRRHRSQLPPPSRRMIQQQPVHRDTEILEQGNSAIPQFHSISSLPASFSRESSERLHGGITSLPVSFTDESSERLHGVNAVPQCHGIRSLHLSFPGESSERLHSVTADTQFHKGSSLRECIHGERPQGHSNLSLPVSPTNSPSGLQLDHLLSGTRTSVNHSPLLPFEDHLRRQINHLQSSPFGVYGQFVQHASRHMLVPLSWSVPPQQVPSTNFSKSELQSASIPANKTLSPSSDASDVSIDVEVTSPTGSTTSSGFCSNPSPTLSSARSSPSEGTSPCREDPNSTTVNHRTCYSQKQARRLKEVFLTNKYPDAQQLEELSEELDLPCRRLKVWFQNRRAREKKNLCDTKMAAYQFPVQSAMMTSAAGYGYPMMHHPLYPPTSALPVMPTYPSNMFPFPYQQ